MIEYTALDTEIAFWTLNVLLLLNRDMNFIQSQEIFCNIAWTNKKFGCHELLYRFFDKEFQKNQGIHFVLL